MNAVEMGAVLIAGLAIRMGLLLVVLAALSIPVYLLIGGMKGLDAIRRRLAGVMRVGHVFWSDNVYYAPGHTWVRETGRKRVLVGIDDLAQRLFAAPTGVKLPVPGTVVRAGQPIAEIRTPTRRAAIVSPVSGTVTRVNESVRDNSALVHRDPYSRGWLFAVTPSDDAYASLPTGSKGRTWLWDEEHRLSRFFETQLGAAAADGGEFITHPPELLHEEQWRQLTREFLANA
ncbi:MAG: glycine cleavage system protein H [Acidobacteria bacterium]|nr:glycine cleavage system protein H [Acidobacteriota bacterium]